MPSSPVRPDPAVPLAAPRASRRARRALKLAPALACALLLVACGPPRGEDHGRIGTTDTHPSEARRSEVLPADLIEFSEQVSEQLARDIIDRTPRIRDADERVTVILGDINNRTQIVSSNDFEMMLRRTRSLLNNAPVTRERLMFVEDRARMRDLAQREGVARDDGTAGPDAYDPEQTYVLNGDFFYLGRGRAGTYYMEVQLSHFASNEQVFSASYDARRGRQ